MSLMPRSAEQCLWQHVLLAILSDLQSSSEHAHWGKISARRWVGLYPTKDFRMVCDLAGLDPDYLHQQFRRVADKDRFVTKKTERRSVVDYLPSKAGTATQVRKLQPRPVVSGGNRETVRFG